MRNEYHCKLEIYVILKILGSKKEIYIKYINTSEGRKRIEKTTDKIGKLIVP